MLTTITTEQFTNKVYHECPFEFLIGEYDMELSELETMTTTQLKETIVIHAQKMNTEAMIGFIEMNCYNLNLY